MRFPTITPAIIILLLPLTIGATPPSISAKEIQAIERTYTAIDDLIADFRQETHVELVGRTITKRGTFTYKKPDRFHIAYRGAGEKHYTSDGEILWVFVPDDAASLEAFRLNGDNVPREALSFLGGFAKLTKLFRVSASAAFPKHRAGEDALHLLPRKKGAHYDALDALFGSDHLLRELVVHNRPGNVTHYYFSNIRTNTGVSETRFTPTGKRATPAVLPQ